MADIKQLLKECLFESALRICPATDSISSRARILRLLIGSVGTGYWALGNVMNYQKSVALLQQFEEYCCRKVWQLGASLKIKQLR